VGRELHFRRDLVKISDNPEKLLLFFSTLPMLDFLDLLVVVEAQDFVVVLSAQQSMGLVEFRVVEFPDRRFLQVHYLMPLDLQKELARVQQLRKENDCIFVLKFLSLKIY
jgi:hypothetical protein